LSASAATTVLQLDQVWVPLPDEPELGVAIDLTLRAGDLVLVQPGDEQHEQLLADLACGLVPPARGAARFVGRDWSKMPPDQANALRGRIGAVLRRGAWMPHLSLLDNLLLPQLYHTRRPYQEIRAEAARWAAWFGLAGLPTGRPADVPSSILERAACVRAFLGVPSLIIVESLPGGLAEGLLAPLVNAIRVMRDRDAAVLWFVRDRGIYEDRSLPATGRLRLLGDALVPLEAVG
jgi:phospholipid/cholesterol/gamma-HCH transport system ATP-binding protein